MFWLLQITLLGMPRLFPQKLKQHWPTAKLLWNNFILHYGLPSKIITDQGRNFERELIEHLCQLAGVQKLYWKYSQSKHKQKPTMSLEKEIPLYPWTKLATYQFHFEDASYLLIVDYTRRFHVVHKLSSMNGQHVANQCQLIFSEYGWQDTFVHYIYITSDNWPCYTVETFNSVMNAYYVNHITSSPHYPQSNGLAEKYVQIVKNLFYKAKGEGKDMFKCLIIYCNTPLSGSLQSPMQILQSRSTRSGLPMTNAARQQLGLQSEQLRIVIRNEHLPSHDLNTYWSRGHASRCYKQMVVSSHYYQLMCTAKKLQYLLQGNGVTYRKTQAHLKPYQPQSKKSEDEHSVIQSTDKQTLKADCKQFDSMNNQVQFYYRPKRGIQPPVQLDLWSIMLIIWSYIGYILLEVDCTQVATQ